MDIWQPLIISLYQASIFCPSDFKLKTFPHFLSCSLWWCHFSVILKPLQDVPCVTFSILDAINSFIQTQHVLKLSHQCWVLCRIFILFWFILIIIYFWKIADVLIIMSAVGSSTPPARADMTGGQKKSGGEREHRLRTSSTAWIKYRQKWSWKSIFVQCRLQFVSNYRMQLLKTKVMFPCVVFQVLERLKVVCPETRIHFACWENKHLFCSPTGNWAGKTNSQNIYCIYFLFLNKYNLWCY